jgi:hypothetical protein
VVGTGVAASSFPYTVSVMNTTDDSFTSTAVPMEHADLQPAACRFGPDARLYVMFNNASLDNNEVRRARVRLSRHTALPVCRV